MRESSSRFRRIFRLQRCDRLAAALNQVSPGVGRRLTDRRRARGSVRGIDIADAIFDRVDAACSESIISGDERPDAANRGGRLRLRGRIAFVGNVIPSPGVGSEGGALTKPETIRSAVPGDNFPAFDNLSLNFYVARINRDMGSRLSRLPIRIIEIVTVNDYVAFLRLRVRIEEISKCDVSISDQRHHLILFIEKDVSERAVRLDNPGRRCRPEVWVT